MLKHCSGRKRGGSGAKFEFVMKRRRVAAGGTRAVAGARAHERARAAATVARAHGRDRVAGARLFGAIWPGAYDLGKTIRKSIAHLFERRVKLIHQLRRAADPHGVHRVRHYARRIEAAAPAAAEPRRVSLHQAARRSLRVHRPV